MRSPSQGSGLPRGAKRGKGRPSVSANARGRRKSPCKTGAAHLPRRAADQCDRSAARRTLPRAPAPRRPAEAAGAPLRSGAWAAATLHGRPHTPAPPSDPGQRICPIWFGSVVWYPVCTRLFNTPSLSFALLSPLAPTPWETARGAGHRGTGRHLSQLEVRVRVASKRFLHDLPAVRAGRSGARPDGPASGRIDAP